MILYTKEKNAEIRPQKFNLNRFIILQWHAF